MDERTDERSDKRLDKRLLEILVCPVCKGQLAWQEEAGELVCRADRLAFPVRDGIPVMLENEARQMSLEEVEALR